MDPAASSAPGNPRLQRLHDKIESYLASDQLYEAEQIYLTICSRLFGSDQVDEAVDVAVKGALRLLSLHSGKAGAKLAMQLLDFLKTTKHPVSDWSLGTITTVFGAFAPEHKTEKVNFMKTAIKWSATPPTAHAMGHPCLHLELAKYYQGAGLYSDANRHLLKSQDDAAHYRLLTEWASRVEPNERDLLVARTVLQYLALEDREGAEKVLARLPADSLPTPLINFIRFLVEAVRRDSAPLFQMLKSKYAASIQRDSSFSKYLDRIGLIYFHIQSGEGQGMGGFLSQLLSSISD